MQDDHFRDNHSRPSRRSWVSTCGAQHDLLDPFFALEELLKQLEAKALERETADARLYAELEESIAASIHATPRKG